MALIKIYSKQDSREKLFNGVAQTIKLVTTAALNVPEVPTSTGSVETVYAEGIDLIGIDYILEVVAVKRPNQQVIAENIIKGLGEVYPDKLFSVYFNTIQEQGMAHTPRQSELGEMITMQEAVKRSRNGN